MKVNYMCLMSSGEHPTHLEDTQAQTEQGILERKVRRKEGGATMTAASFKLPNWKTVHRDFTRGMLSAILLAKTKIKNNHTIQQWGTSENNSNISI
jgi:hypothetical protein